MHEYLFSHEKYQQQAQKINTVQGKLNMWAYIF